MKETDSVRSFGIDCWLKSDETSKFLFLVMLLRSPLVLIKAKSMPVFGSNAIWLSGLDADIEAINNFAFMISF